MGLPVETLNISLEKRYVGFNIVKEVDGTVSGVINVSIGYYDTENSNLWLSVKESVIRLNNDALTMLFSLKPSQLGLPTDPMLVQSIDTVIYGVITGTIKLNANVHITIKNANGEDLTGTVTLKRQGVLISQVYAAGKVDLNIDLMLGASIDIDVVGYKHFTKSYQALSGTVNLAVVLEPEAVTGS